jgi:hypothetical protein
VIGLLVWGRGSWKLKVGSGEVMVAVGLMEKILGNGGEKKGAGIR